MKAQPIRVCTGVVLASLTCALTTSAQPPYSNVTIEALPGDSYVNATGLNNHGHVVGYSYGASPGTRAFLWTSAAGLQPLGDDAAGNPTINDADEIALDIGSRAFRITPNGEHQLLPTLGGSVSHANAINNAGFIVGYAQLPFLYDADGHVIGGGQNRACVWDNTNQIHSLGEPPPDFPNASTEANAINATGMVVGRILGQPNAVFVWTALTGMQPIESLTNTSASPHFLNSNGVFVGVFYPQGTSPLPFSCSATNGVTTLGLCGFDLVNNVPNRCGQTGSALGILDNGDVVGWVFVDTNTGGLASIYRNGSMSLIYRGTAAAINVAGQILVNGVDFQGHLLTPCPADLNHDALVDDSDFVIFAQAYDLLDCSDPTMPAECPADLNGDSVVDDSDFVIFVDAYNALLCP